MHKYYLLFKLFVHNLVNTSKYYWIRQLISAQDPTREGLVTTLCLLKCKRPFYSANLFLAMIFLITTSKLENNP